MCTLLLDIACTGFAFSFVGGRFSSVLPRQNYVKIVLKRSLMLVVLLGFSLHSVAAGPYVVDLATVTPSGGVRYTGSESLGSVGFDLAMIGDHNNDGFKDYVVASYRISTAVIVMKKNTTYTESEVMITDIVSGQYYRLIKGIRNANCGSSLSGIGDINSDGFDDVLIGCAYGAVTGRSSSPGYAVVIFGMTGPFIDVTITQDWPATTIGFQILGTKTSTSFVGFSLASRGLGDVNDDGVPDFAVSARGYEGTTSKIGAGVVWVIFGKRKGDPYNTTMDMLPANFGSNGIYYTGAFASDWFGNSVVPVGDFNGDGIADFLIGAPQFDPIVNGTIRADAGAVYLIYGSKTALATMDMSTFVTGAMGVRFLGFLDGGKFGRYANGVGDVNGDGIDDIAIGTPLYDLLSPSRANCGVVHVIFGTTVEYTADVDLLSFTDFTKGFAIYGRAANMQLANIARVGDVDGDGVNDILVGGASSSSRAAHIVYGQTAPRTANVDTFKDDVITFSYSSDFAGLGISLDGGIDVNGDGHTDIMLGAPNRAANTFSQAGNAFMLPGPFSLPPAPTTKPTSAPTFVRTASPTVFPTAPSAVPSQNPSVTPSVGPSAAPSQDPSVTPSAAPSALPSADPSAIPSQVPSVTPSADPSAAPSQDPSVSPSAAPSALPSAPSAAPSQDPSVTPSASPSAVPSAAPTLVPTVHPTSTPSARPSVPALKDYELAVNVEQGVSFVNTTAYDAQQAAYNKTIQHTVADAVDGVTPERVTDIVIEEEEEEGGRVRASAATTGKPVVLKYKITTNDPLLTIETMRAQLAQAAQEGKMDRDLRYYAAQFGATSLLNGTVGEPQVTSAAVQRDASKQLTGVQIALVVISVVVGMFLLIVVILVPYIQRQSSASAETQENEQLDMVM